MLDLVDITKRFNAGTPDESTVFDNFNFKVNAGEFVSVIGSNGSGKTTMLNLICGSYKPDGGNILLTARISQTSPNSKSKNNRPCFSGSEGGHLPGFNNP